MKKFQILYQQKLKLKYIFVDDGKKKKITYINK